MENQTQQLEHSQKTDSLEAVISKNPTIGFNKYSHLKTKKKSDLTEEEIFQIEDFEFNKNTQSEEQRNNYYDYFSKIHESKPKSEFSITAKALWNLFKHNFQAVNNRPFIKIEGITIKNLEPIIYYFSKDKRFFECENLSKLSEPSFDKGLLIIGTYGNGKTSTMKVFEHIFKGISGITFKGYSANEAVLMFEKCTGDNAEALRTEFQQTMYRGTRYFDDLKTERIASNFGKVNIFKEILEERYNKKSKTFITCNYKDGFDGDLEIATDEFGEKYGARVYDRIFEMFNIIEFKGKSFRK